MAGISATARFSGVRWCTKSGSTVYDEEMLRPRLKKAMSPPSTRKFQRIVAGQLEKLLGRVSTPVATRSSSSRYDAHHSQQKMVTRPDEHITGNYPVQVPPC